MMQRTYILTYIHTCYVHPSIHRSVQHVCMYLRTYISTWKVYHGHHTNSETSARLTRPSTKVSPERRQKKGREGERESCRGQCSPHVGVCCSTLLLASKRWVEWPPPFPFIHPSHPMAIPFPHTAAGFSISISTRTAFGSGQAREATAARRMMPFSSDRLRPQ